MNQPSVSTNSGFTNYSLLQALIERRSRRFAAGMKLDGGPLTFESDRAPQLLSEGEEAALAFAACGVTGWRPIPDIVSLSGSPFGPRLLR
jgi:hypothetical protein